MPSPFREKNVPYNRKTKRKGIIQMEWFLKSLGRGVGGIVKFFICLILIILGLGLVNIVLLLLL